ncbi:flagellar hook-length control protein FliK [Hydrogenimonas urashimensis]|uniref:flagellar hook-length control protein FliK n=1 Tax=Hydrogenimonas urashimensis TaxID=2740515 RepID=UPI001915B562|nr:flagellar hook-length control protein FliK [Hydrogenimonas urashimensis]
MALLQLSALLTKAIPPGKGKADVLSPEGGDDFFKELFQLLLGGKEKMTQTKSKAPLGRMLHEPGEISKKTPKSERVAANLPNQAESPREKAPPMLKRTIVHIQDFPENDGRLPLLHEDGDTEAVKVEIPVLQEAAPPVKRIKTQKGQEKIAPAAPIKISEPLLLRIVTKKPQKSEKAPPDGAGEKRMPSLERLFGVFVPFSPFAPDEASPFTKNRKVPLPLQEPPFFSKKRVAGVPEILQTGHAVKKRGKRAKRVTELVDFAKNIGLNPKRASLHIQKKSEPTPLFGNLPHRTHNASERNGDISRSTAELLRRPFPSHAPKNPKTVPPQELGSPTEETAAAKESAGAGDTPANKEGSAPVENALKKLMELTAHPDHRSRAAKKETTAAQKGPDGIESPRKEESKQPSSEISDPNGLDLPDHLVAENTKTGESLHQKIADAKATVRHFARQLQEQVENYKPPFTRMKMLLEPKELGAVELTLVNRGSNLHVQVHSNPNAIGLMATQGQELKSQLVSMGFSDVQMQFSMNQQQQRPRHNMQKSRSEGDVAIAEERSDFYDSLNIIIPYYI